MEYLEGARAAAAATVTMIRLAAALGTTELRPVGAATPLVITKRIANLSEAALIPSGRLHAPAQSAVHPRRSAVAVRATAIHREYDEFTSRGVESFAGS